MQIVIYILNPIINHRASFASWLLMNLLLIAVPRYGAYTKCVTGLLLICTAVGYYLMLPQRPLTIAMEAGRLEFRLGWCFWLVLCAGILCLTVGLLIAVVDLVWPHRFSTILEVYYDTPYDRHVILEESHDVRYRKRNSRNGLEEAGGGAGLGSRILRRLSSKTKEQAGFPSAAAAAATMGSGVVGAGGATAPAAASPTTMGPTAAGSGGGAVDNRGIPRSAVPNSPWRYPFRRTPLVTTPPNGGTGPAMLQRTMSQDSTSSSIVSASGATAGGVAMALSSTGLPPNGAAAHKVALSRMLP